MAEAEKPRATRNLEHTSLNKISTSERHAQNDPQSTTKSPLEM